MPDRDQERRGFLCRSGAEGFRLAPLAGDASARQYFRADGRVGQTYVLMDCPGPARHDITRFVTVAEHLRDAGLSAPEIHAFDESLGFVLLEDLTDALYARILANRPRLEAPAYLCAVDVLVTLRGTPVRDFAAYHAAEMALLSALAETWYARRAESVISPALEPDLQKLEGPRVLALRDYHAENLIWLPDRHGPARTGLLDFQDAAVTHPAYDLVSLLEDARRDLGPGIADAALAHYLQQTGDDPEALGFALHLLGAQRNLRILGVFARLARAYGKPRYLGLIPRVWGHLMRDLSHPDLAGLKDCVLATLPPPTPGHLEALRTS